VIYPLSTASPSVKGIIAANPMTPVLEGIRLGLLGKGDMSMASLAYALVSSLVILLTGVIVFNRVEKTFIDSV
jgi:lipopolysaccharide transport system permease protein